MSGGRAVQRYALALHAAAVETGCLANVRGDLERIAAMLGGSRDLRRFLPDYAAGRTRRARALAALFAGRVSDLTWRLVRLLEERKRLGLLPDIGKVFPDVCRKKEGRLRGAMWTAFPADPAFAGSVVSRFERLWGRPISFDRAEDPDLIGGLRVRVEDVLYDMSVRGLLRRMQGEHSF